MVCGVYRVLKSKYLQRNSLLDVNYTKHTGCSSTWSSILKLYGATLLRDGVLWRVGNGQSKNFWIDNWTGLARYSAAASYWYILILLVMVLLFKIFCPIMFGIYINMLQTCLPTHVVDRIAMIPVSCSSAAEASPNGQFSVSSAYVMVKDSNSLPQCFWKCIWSFKIPPKLKMFSWIVAQGRLLTNAQRFRRNICSDSSCSFYNSLWVPTKDLTQNGLTSGGGRAIIVLVGQERAITDDDVRRWRTKLTVEWQVSQKDKITWMRLGKEGKTRWTRKTLLPFSGPHINW